MMVGMYKAMPDLHMTIEDMIAEGDKVVCRNIWRWTDSTGKKMHNSVLSPLTVGIRPEKLIVEGWAELWKLD